MIRRLIPIVTALTLLGCANQTPSKMEIPLLDAPGSKQTLVTKLTPGKHEASIMSIGGDRDLARQQAGGQSMGFINNQEIESYLNGIRDRLLATSGVTEVPGKVKLMADLSHGAKASADGNIFVPITWLIDAESEDVLAALIAHELSHVLFKHQSTEIVASIQKKLQSSHEMLLGLKMDINKTSQLTKKDNKAMLAAQISVSLVDGLAMPAWNRRQETEADLLAVDLMTRAGYSPDGMTDMLEILKKGEANAQKRQDDIEKRIKELFAQDPKLGLDAAFNALKDELKKNHPETQKRVEAVIDYRDKHYADERIPDYSTASLKKLKTSRTTGALLTNYKHALAAKIRLNDGKLEMAYGEARKGVMAPTSKDPVPNWILWQTATALGKERQHEAALKNALNSPEPIKELYEAKIDFEEQAGRNQIALNFVIEAQKKFGDAPEWAPRKIKLLSKLGRKDEAKAEAAKCALDTPEFKKECRSAANS
jgi:beta-barrel assembly-enhancing protease